MLNQAKSVLITGGCGTLGRAILRLWQSEKWECKMTVFSSDPMKHIAIRKMFPGVNSVIGDICDSDTVYNAMAGCDMVVHAAALKHIPESEKNSIDTYRVNVEGSFNVARAAINHGVKHVVAISTDKACNPANAYGCTKMMMEKEYQELSRVDFDTQLHLVRYGNVLESTGSVIEVWKKQVENSEPVRVTNLDMTRFYLSPSRAAELVVKSMFVESGNILIPKMKSLSLKKLLEYTVGDVPIQQVPMRPGEKIHETLLTVEEGAFAEENEDYIFLRPSTSERNKKPIRPYTSDDAHELSKDELLKLLEDG